ncbi:histidine kinase dimerization/phospho-acceptor domain-containing protein [Pelagerythrobacter sp.]|uniref:histidine kinase dimerization/phospho-acceptor domain-containing protein n=1 Tax=Pelagerythrobacter sp. TaxID=2800702 RepID=UPI0035B2BB43
MQFDDRLATVLRHRASGGRAAHTQFRQLLDLLGARRGGHDGKLLSSAWLRLGALGEAIAPRERATMIRDGGWRFGNPELAAHLAEEEPEVAAAALARADLSEDDWEALIPRLPIRARGFLRLRRGLPPRAEELLERLGIHDRGLPDPGPAASPDVTPFPAREREPLELTVPANDYDDGEIEEESAIGALVRRIEAFQRARAEGVPNDTSPRLPLGEQDDTARPPLAGFAFTTDGEGRIDWAEPHVAPMVVGTVLADAAFRKALREWRRVERMPVELRGASLVAGHWVVDAAPRFTVPSGRFYGMAGKLRRPPVRAAAAVADTEGEADRIRQLLHELRTPVNAIQGFAEVIQQQVFGPVPHEYRALAAAIAGDAARMLAGFDELDRLARLETGAIEPLEGDCDFALLCRALAGQLEPVLAPRMSGFEIDIPKGPAVVPLALREGEALAWRLLATLATAVGTGESLPLVLRREAGHLTLTAGVPAALADEEDVFAAAPRPSSGALSAGMFGAGFALRLARAEARAAGGDLSHTRGELRLVLPLLTAAGRNSSAVDQDEDRRRPQAR